MTTDEATPRATSWTTLWLYTKFSGSLTIIIRTLNGRIYDWSLGPILDGTIFDYIEKAYACIFADPTKNFPVQTRKKDWKVLAFHPSAGVLLAQQVGGVNLIIEENDYEKQWLSAPQA